MAHGSNTKAAIFDYDGLMVDSESAAADALIAYLATHGVSVELAGISHLFGGTGPEMDLLWEGFLGDVLGGEVDLGQVSAELDELILTVGMGNPLLPGARDLVRAARQASWGVGLATGRRRQRLLPELARHDLLEAFDAIVTAEEVDRGKPAPDIFLAVADRLRVRPADCVVLEDSLHGCEAGLAAGMTVIVCPSPATAACDFPAPARRVRSLADVALHTVFD